MEFLYLLESLRSPFLDTFFGLLTYLGDEIIFIAIAITVYWCLDKAWGYYLLTVGFLGLLINQFTKIIAQIPRPWVRDPNFTIVESAREAAGGYSFPSGHTANATDTMGSIARFSRKTAVRIIMIVLIVLISFSRMYLGVHTPADVLFSLVVGVILIFGVYPFFAKHRNEPKMVAIIMAIPTVLSFAFAIFVQSHDWGADIDAANLQEAMKNAWLLSGCGAGALVSLWIENRYVKFSTAAPLWAQVAKIALGLLLVLGIRIGLKAVFSACFGHALFLDGLRYFCIVVFAAAIWPMTFTWFARGCKKKENAHEI